MNIDTQLHRLILKIINRVEVAKEHVTKQVHGISSRTDLVRNWHDSEHAPIFELRVKLRAFEQETQWFQLERSKLDG